MNPRRSKDNNGEKDALCRSSAALPYTPLSRLLAFAPHSFVGYRYARPPFWQEIAHILERGEFNLLSLAYDIGVSDRYGHFIETTIHHGRFRKDYQGDHVAGTLSRRVKSN